MTKSEPSGDQFNAEELAKIESALCQEYDRLRGQGDVDAAAEYRDIAEKVREMTEGDE